MLTDRYEAYGHDLSVADIEKARRSVPGAVFTQGPADRIPFGEDFFDGVLLLDVLEHVPDEGLVVDEIARVLRPGGKLIVSVPNRGALAVLDALNLYRSLLGDRAPAPTDDPSWPKSPVHRHYSVDDLSDVLGERLTIQTVEFTGIGLAEIVNLVLLLVFQAFLHSMRLYRIVRYLYFGAYLVEDLIRTGTRGYHLMVVARRL